MGVAAGKGVGGVKEAGEMRNKEETIKGAARIPKLRPREISLMLKSPKDLGRGEGKLLNMTKVQQGQLCQ